VGTVGEMLRAWEMKVTIFGSHDLVFIIGPVFMGCALSVDDILLLSANCLGVQQIVSVCVKYGKLWDI